MLIRESSANGVIADDPLSPAQMKNLAERFPDVKIMDRTVLILDIFAAHANTREGALQVEEVFLPPSPISAEGLMACEQGSKGR